MILPLHKIRYTTRRSLSECESVLKSVITDSEWSGDKSKEYIGYVDGRRFRMRARFGWTRNSWKPFVSGELLQDDNGATVNATFYPDTYGTVISVAFVLGVLWAFHWNGVWFALFIIVMSMAGFLTDAKRLNESLLSLLPASTETEAKALSPNHEQISG